MSTDSIGKLSISQVLSAFGEIPLNDSLHVFIQQSVIQHLLIKIPFRLDHYSVMLVTRGACEMQLNFKTYSPAKNDLILLIPDTLNQFMSWTDDFHFKLVSFDTALPVKLGLNEQHVDAFSFFTSQQPIMLSLREEESADISALIDLLDQKSRVNGHPFRKELTLHAFSLLMFEISALIKRTLKVSRNQLSRNEELTLRFLKLLAAHVVAERSVQFYANRLAVTPNYLNKLSKKTLYKTAGSFIDEAVIQEAKLLLHKSSLSIAQVAAALYFKDQFHFSKFFKKKAGMSPSAYRKLGV